MENVNKISQAELVVMQALWEIGSPVSTGELYKVLTSKMGWDRSTVRTLLKRLTEKGAVTVKKINVMCYTPTITEEEYLEEQTKSFLDNLYGGSAKRLVSSLVENYDLSENDIEELREYFNKECEKHD
ncbi:BlaI/MecI/CopY family transcriptional regulator [Anaeromicropila herbilytica]|uniref:Transcriptional regulator n=1 Tax=Anaeromicropila herbilytica TaxID=2785025 RepID=A0A7R7IC06_9FIRM|nr:BlaI/MecI/CopY family transcriptional regulator [Anaeromicropila herbilytica]BCN29346.1 transcriptional regulator [Anaeromicropila herbilytica]